MKYRVTFARKASATKAGQAGRRFAVEVMARNEPEATQFAIAQATREGNKLDFFDIMEVRKV